MFEVDKRDERDLESALADFQRATELDPDYALAYAGLADAIALRGSLLYMALPPAEVMPKARDAAHRALQLDAGSAEAHATLGWIALVYDWDWDASRREFERAIELNPNYAQAHHRYAFYLAAMGRADRAVSEMERARDLDPLSLSVNANLGWVLFCAGRYDDAVRALRKVQEVDASFFLPYLHLSQIYGSRDLHELAIAQLRHARKLAPANTSLLGSLGYETAASGGRTEATALLEELTSLSQRRFVSPYALAEIYVGLGDRDGAFRSLEQAYQARDNELVFLRIADPVTRALGPDPRFKGLLERMHLTD